LSSLVGLTIGAFRKSRQRRVLCRELAHRHCPECGTGFDPAEYERIEAALEAVSDGRLEDERNL